MERTLVWAHRGASGYAPENTMEAFRKAYEMGADGIQLDVQMTKDGELVVIHDETIERVSDGTGWVKDMTLAKLRKYNFNKTHPEYLHAEIPTLEEVYEWIKPTNMTINVEIRTNEVFYSEIEERILDMTERMGLKDRVIFSSFNHYTVQKIKELDPTAETGMLYCDGIISPISYGAYVVGADALQPSILNLQYINFIRDCKKAHMKLHVWTINEEQEMRMLCENQVEAMITDYPDLAVEISQEYRNGQILPEIIRALEGKRAVV